MNPILVVHRPLDEWYKQINRIYLDRNFYRDSFSIFAHLTEIVGGLSLLASEKTKVGTVPRSHIPKAIAWWMTLCGKVGVRSVEQLLWWKFPSICPYCQFRPHRDDECQEAKKAGGPNWVQLEEKGKDSEAKRPSTLGDWQKMFASIYPVGQTEGYATTFARFAEELGELAEALRVFPLAPGYFLSEAADVFAWLMHLQEILYKKTDVPRANRGKDLEQAFWEAYPDRCSICENVVCTCPPILPSTLGRIAHDVPGHRASFSEGGALLPVDEAMELFAASARSVRIGQEVILTSPQVLADMNRGIQQLLHMTLEGKGTAEVQSKKLTDALYKLEEMTAMQRLTQDNIDALAEAVTDLEPPARSRFVDYLNNISAGLWASALVQLAQNIATSH